MIASPNRLFIIVGRIRGSYHCNILRPLEVSKDKVLK